MSTGSLRNSLFPHRRFFRGQPSPESDPHCPHRAVLHRTSSYSRCSGLATLKNVGSRTKNVGSRAKNNQKQQKNLVLSNQVNLTQVTKGSNVVCSLDSEPQLAFLNALKNGAAAAAANAFFWAAVLFAAGFFFEHDSREAEQKARASGILTIVTSFMFVCTLYFLSDVMPQLTIFCKTLQAVDITLEGVLAAYDVTRATLVSYKTDIKNMPFLRRFAASVLDGTCQDVKLPTLFPSPSPEYRACVADNLSKWDKPVRVPFLGHLTQKLFEVFNNTKPTLMALLSLAKPPRFA